MYAINTMVATLALLFTSANASPIESRQTIYGCYFNGDGIVNTYVSVGHDSVSATGTSGKTHTLDCGTTSDQIVAGVYAKCLVDGVQPAISAISGDSVNINCTF